MRAWLFACLALLCVSLTLALPAAAQESAPEALLGDDNIAVELISEGLPTPGEEWTLALRFTPDDSLGEEWHGYWSNPGDAGFGMQLELNLPDGWEVGEALYPVPERLIISELMNHVYNGPYTVLVPIAVPQNADVSSVSSVTGFVSYLACTDEICVPQDAALISKPEVRTGDFSSWRAAIAPLLAAPSTFEIDGQTLRIAIPLPASVDLANPHVFIANTELVNYVAPQVFRRSGDALVAEIPLSGSGDTDTVSGIVAFGAMGEAANEGVRFVAAPGAVPTGGELIVAMDGSSETTPPIWLLLLGALAGGLILNVMPCVFPILSIKALALARAGGDESEARSDALAYTAGVVLACAALGGVMLALRAGGEQVGWAFQLQSPGVVVFLLVLAVAITANFAGLFELPQLSFTGKGGRTGSFATGLLAAFVATPVSYTHLTLPTKA